MPTRRSLIACVLGWLAGAATFACEVPESLGLARYAPAGTDVLIVLSDAACLRSTPAGAAISRAAENALGDGNLGRSWAALAERLGWSEEEAFDRLLGRRAALVLRGLPDGVGADEPEWAILSEVTASTERRLRERLDVSARSIKGNSTIYAVEQGVYELTARLVEGRAIVLFGPSKRHALFDEIAPTLGGAPEPAPIVRSALELLDGQKDATIAAFARDPADPDGWSALAASQRGVELRGWFAAATKACAGIPLESVVRWDASTLDDLGESAFMAGVDLFPLEDDRVPGLAQVITALPMLAVLRGDGMGPSRRFAYIIGPGADDDAPLDVACSVESADPDAVAATMDNAMGSMLAAIGAPGVDFGGVAPGAMRLATLPPLGPLSSLGLQRGPDGTTRLLWGASFGDEGEPGWWSFGLGGESARRLTDGLGLLRRDDERGARWVSVGVARPAAALAHLEEAGAAIPAEFGLVGAVDEVRWAFEMLPGGRQGGEFMVRFSDPAPAAVQR